MNKLLRFTLFILIMFNVTRASEFNDAINDVFGYAANYFAFDGTFNSGSNTITLSKVTRNGDVYGNRDAFPLAISGSKKVRRDDTDITYTVILDNNSEIGNHLFNFSNNSLPVILTLSDIAAPEDCRYMFYGCYGLKGLNLSNFDTSNVIDMTNMFVECTGLKVLKVKSDFPANPDMEDAAMENMFGGRTVDHGKLIIFSDDTDFNPRFKNFVETYECGGIFYKDIVTLLHLVLKISANGKLTFGQDANVSFGDESGILFEDSSVLANATDITCPTENGQMAYLVLADREISSTIENLLMIKHDKDFNEDTEHVYRVIPRGKISGNYKMVTWDDTHNIAIVNSNKVYLKGLLGLTNADTVFFVVKNGESIDDQNTVVIKNETDESVEIAAKISNSSSKENYAATNLSLQGKLEFSGDLSGFVNGKTTTSGADVEFVGDKSIFPVPLELTGNSKVKISVSVDHGHDIEVEKGSQLEIKENVTLSYGTFRFGC